MCMVWSGVKVWRVLGRQSWDIRQAVRYIPRRFSPAYNTADSVQPPTQQAFSPAYYAADSVQPTTYSRFSPAYNTAGSVQPTTQQV